MVCEKASRITGDCIIMDRLLGNSYTHNTPVFQLQQSLVFADQFYAQVLALAQQFQQVNLSRWALCFTNSYQFAIALLALLIADKQPILLPNYQSGTLHTFAHEYDAVFSDNPEIASYVFDKQTVHTTNIPLTLPPHAKLIFFTSGTTGKPKRIERLLSTLLNEVIMLESTFGQTMQNACIYSSVSHQHVYGLLFYILWPLFAGRTIVYPTLYYLESIANVFNTSEKIVFISSPSVLSRLTKVPSKNSSVVVFSSGNLLKENDAQTLQRNGNIIPIEILGSTETGAVAMRQQMIQAS
jgi:acyl-coenzyme A synthetase/AMP-(fatty) acid ligase